MPEPALALWAKSDREAPGRWHPLVSHGTDTGIVAQVLLERAMGGRPSERLAGGLGLAPADLAPWVGFLAAAHDIGKATPRFQAL
jgi:CRISPR-associated endonuclease/helicase Cas3